MKTFAACCICATLALVSPASAITGIPDPSFSTATSNAGHLFIAPNGTGPSLADANVVITVTLLDGFGVPIAGYPFQDIWVDDDGNGDLFVCQSGSVADQSTDVSGMTTFSGSIAGGGATQAGLRVYVAGLPIDTSPLSIDVSSPDYNGDLLVNIADLGQFAFEYLNGQYDFHSDFNGDGKEDLADLGIFAAHNGTHCP